jgi:transcriptional regulator with XRE-family HTH domain
MDQARAPFGRLLRHWRMLRGRSQLALALQAEVSARHLSWLETGKAQPSRAMVLRLAEQLEVPLRERNAWLVAAGYAPLYAERPLTDPGLAAARAAVQRLLDAHEPWPALAVDRHWTLVAHNRMVPMLMGLVSEALRTPPVNVLRLSLHPQGLAPLLCNLPAWRAHVLARLQRQQAATADATLAALLQELQALPLPEGSSADTAGQGPVSAPGASDIAVPVSLNTPAGRLDFITTITVFGAPHDVTVSELAVETLLPANETTAQALRALHASLG